MAQIFNEILSGNVSLPEKPKRIVSLYPSVTETLVELGATQELVGVSSHCFHFVKGLKKPSVSSMLEVNYERLKELRPDLVLTTSRAQRNLALELYRKGYCVFPIHLATSLYGIISNVVSTGMVVGRGKEAQELGRKLARELEASRLDIEYEKRPWLYLEIWPEKYSKTAGGFSFINDLISATGALNIFTEKPIDYFTADFDEVKVKNPDLIIFLFESSRKMQEIDISLLLTKRGWSGIKAARGKRVIKALEGDLPLTHSGPSFVRTIRLLSEKLKEFGVLPK